MKTRTFALLAAVASIAVCALKRARSLLKRKTKPSGLPFTFPNLNSVIPKASSPTANRLRPLSPLSRAVISCAAGKRRLWKASSLNALS